MPPEWADWGKKLNGNKAIPVTIFISFISCLAAYPFTTAPWTASGRPSKPDYLQSLYRHLQNFAFQTSDTKVIICIAKSRGERNGKKGHWELFRLIYQPDFRQQRRVQYPGEFRCGGG
jgi:hypothetical protein